MAANTDTRNQVKEITDQLEQGVKDLFTSEKYMAYLQTMSRFHRYSTRNTLLIHMQKPDATLVAGFQAWRSKFGRYVTKGETGIRILAPTPFVIKEERQKLDPDTRTPVMGDDGLPIMEEVEKKFARFRVVHVYDVSQTDGKPLPNLAEDLTGDVRHYELFMDSLRAVSPLPIGFEPLDPGTDGVCRMGRNIAIREGMSEIQTVSATIHEITHAKLHDIEILRQQDKNAKPKDRRTEEVEAESVSYAVCQYYGIETAPNSFGYLAEWSKTRELKELNASLDTIRKTATDLIDAIDEQYRAIAKERGIELAAVKTEPDRAEQVAPASSLHDSEPGRNDAQLGRAAFERLKSGDMVYLNQAIKPVQLVRIRESDVLFVAPELAVELTQTHEQVVQSLLNHPQNHHFLDTAEREVPAVPVQAAMQDLKQEVQTTLQFLIDEDMKNHGRLSPGTLDAVAVQGYEYRNGKLEQAAPAAEPTAAAGQIPVFRETRSVGEIVLMPLLFDSHGNLERTDKRTRVQIEPPIGKYAVYSREDGDITKGYLLTDSGKLIFIDEYKHMSDMSEATFDESFANAKSRVSRLLQDPDEWVNFSDAAIANRIAEAEKHNAPIREAREAGYKAERRESAERQRTEQQDHENAFNDSIDALSEKIIQGERTIIEIDRYLDKNPLFALFDRHNVDLPLATKGWVNRNLKSFQLQSDGSVTAWLPKGIKMSASFAHALRELKTAIETDKAAERIVGTVMKEAEKQYELGFGHMGNGLTVWNRLEEKNGDYVTVAHIAPDRSVTFYDKDMPDSVKEQIENVARTTNITVSATQDTPVFRTPAQEPEVRLKPPTMPNLDDVAEQLEPPTPFDFGGEIEPGVDELHGIEIMPDSSITTADLREYGYAHDGMLPVRLERALELYDQECTIYMLYEDNTEAMVFDREEIALEHGVFGIEVDEWRSSPEYKRMESEQSEGTREAMLLYGEKNAYGIYQLKGGDELRYHRWASLAELAKDDLKLDRANYELVYTAPLDIRDKLTNLHKIYNTFNGDGERPMDFTGHSISTSDVIVLQWNGEVTSHYVDGGWNFKELISFLGNEAQPELASQEQPTYSQLGNTLESPTSPSSGPTVAELEARANAGQQISLVDLARAVNNERRPTAHKGKPSLLAQLQEYKNGAAQGVDSPKTAPKIDNNREV